MKDLLLLALIIIFIPFLANVLATVLLFVWFGNVFTGFGNITGPFLAFFQGYLGAVLVGGCIAKYFNSVWLASRGALIGSLLWGLCSVIFISVLVASNHNNLNITVWMTVLSLTAYPLGWIPVVINNLKKSPIK